MKNAVNLLVFIYILALSNCGFTSDFPITEKPDGEIEEALLETWFFVDTTKKVAYYRACIELIEWSNAEYLAIVSGFQNDGDISYLQHYKVFNLL